MTEIRYAEESDRAFWFRLDAHLPKTEFTRKITNHEGYVLSDGGVPKGILRYHLFWDEIPFCTLLYIDRPEQRKGYGRALMQFWEADMKSKGYRLLLTSTQTDEEAQHFYRKLGYRDCGGLLLPVPGFEQPLELFLCKEIK